MRNGMKDNLSFERNGNVKRADNAFNEAITHSDCKISRWASGFDEDTGDVLFFIPLSDLNNLDTKKKEKFLRSIRKGWLSAKFKILEEEELSGEEYFHVGYRSQFFRLKSTI